MNVVKKTPAQTLLELLNECRIKKLSDRETLSKCNAWQRERMEAEKMVFGSSLTRELTKEEIGNGLYFLNERVKRAKVK